ncbi:MAG: HD domain-containing protein [Dehalococcoidales bacterium]|nr:HD domain-containing protein [Dehalococcoidales bacterium]
MDRRETSIKQAFARLTEPTIGYVLARVNDFLSEKRIEAYLVGGIVRDALLGRETADIDIAVAADALDVAEKTANALEGHYVLLDKQNRIGRVVLDEWELDFSTFEGTIEQDLARRDFTVNAMAINLHHLLEEAADAQLIDPFKGRDDLRRGVIRAVKEDIFTADPARLLRAVRHAAELDFKIEKSTVTLIQRDANLIAKVAGERIREELLRILAVSDSGRSLSTLDKLGLLTVIFPELAESKGVEQPIEHFWDVFDHSLKTVSAVDFLLRRGNWEYHGKEALDTAPWTPALEEHFAAEVSHGSTRRSLLKLAGLLHDIAKPQTKTTEAGGRVRFLGHPVDGAAVAAAMLTRLRFSAKEIKLVETVIEQHMRPTQMSQEGLPTPRAIYRFFRDTGDAGIDILFFSLADHLAARGPTLDISHWREHTGMIEYVVNQRLARDTAKFPSKLVDGNDLIEKFGLEPGPRIGEILEAVREAQAAGEIKTREEALELVMVFLHKL